MVPCKIHRDNCHIITNRPQLLFVSNKNIRLAVNLHCRLTDKLTSTQLDTHFILHLCRLQLRHLRCKIGCQHIIMRIRILQLCLLCLIREHDLPHAEFFRDHIVGHDGLQRFRIVGCSQLIIIVDIDCIRLCVIQRRSRVPAGSGEASRESRRQLPEIAAVQADLIHQHISRIVPVYDRAAVFVCDSVSGSECIGGVVPGVHLRPGSYSFQLLKVVDADQAAVVYILLRRHILLLFGFRISGAA